MAEPVDQHYTKHKLLSSYPSEVIYQMELAKEYISHVGVEPRHGLLLQGDIPTPGTLSKSSSRPDLVPGAPINPPQSLGVRLWRACQGFEIDDIYGYPTGGETEFDPPIVTMGFVEYSADSNKEVEVTNFGRRFSYSARMTIPVLHHLENGFKHPKEGDLVEFWGRTWHELGVFYNVTKVSPDGHINDTSYYVQWILELRRRDNFLPERRLLSSEPDES